MVDQYYDWNSTLTLKTTYNGRTYIDGGSWSGNWTHNEIYGYIDDQFGLISASCVTESYEEGNADMETGSPWIKHYYLVKDVPGHQYETSVVFRNEVFEEEYKSVVDEWVYTYQYDERTIQFKGEAI